MNKQEVFNRSWQAFVVEKQPASMRLYGEFFNCAYRGENGTKCAVGLCLADEVYRPEFDNPDADTTITALWERYGSVRGLFSEGVDAKFLTDLQDCHDLAFHTTRFAKDEERSGIFLKNVEHRLRVFAVKYQLTIQA